MTTFTATDTQRRFLGAIVDRVQLERVQELYLFAPLRQGGVETGVAVVAVTQASRAGDANAAADDNAAEAVDAYAADAAETATDTIDANAADAAETATDAEIQPDPAVDPRCDPTEAAADEDDSTPTAPRSTVITARYRLQLKGSERGRWEMDVVEEAEAPLFAVDAVVRGVQRRVGDAAEVERLDGADVAALLSDPAWPRTT